MVENGTFWHLRCLRQSVARCLGMCVHLYDRWFQIVPFCDQTLLVFPVTRNRLTWHVAITDGFACALWFHWFRMVFEREWIAWIRMSNVVPSHRQKETTTWWHEVFEILTTTVTTLNNLFIWTRIDVNETWIDVKLYFLEFSFNLRGFAFNTKTI